MVNNHCSITEHTRPKKQHFSITFYHNTYYQIMYKQEATDKRAYIIPTIANNGDFC
jgi:hypothetical protein